MKLCVDGVFYSREPLNFKKILEGIVEILGEDVKVLSLEFPEIAAIVGDTYYYRCGFMLDKELEEEIPEDELKKIKEKIKKLFPEDTIIYTLNCEIL
ncbi:hypothetical protein [Methanotorris igneus]|uniref:Uncharacterized protein n=1 Tax=Methanotorris igneus (strain DSM 5666 / JCM 11834 / Kol 5) TaxID=880724 RepID=F6BEE7_METIK|nr:hypothetical protein [Methanotorris igneus]AEF95608.1 hypothetical protein Metig_0047 [Methanotorris igneus Kol 5]